MFALEKEMTPILKKGLAETFKTSYCVEEFTSGLGRPDLVFGIDVLNNGSFFDDYFILEFYTKHFNRVNKIIFISDLIQTGEISPKKISELIHNLLDAGYITEVEEEYYRIEEVYKPRVKEFISIEAKLCDWKGGMYQAMRYKNFSHRTYLAISANYLHRVDVEMLKANGVGLISVNNNNAEIILKAKKEKPKSQASYNYLGETFVKSYRNSVH